TWQPVYMEDAAILFDKGLRGAIEDIVVGEGPLFGDLQWRITSLSIKVGGVGVVLSSGGSLICFCGFQNSVLEATR
ncbi:hypothetical protein A2U01_0058605, partial [Trifolium medium]|nr:hypothetical protein [Trifolium medium]